MKNSVISVMLSDKTVIEKIFSEKDVHFQPFIQTLSVVADEIEVIELTFPTMEEQLYFYQDIFFIKQNCQKIMTNISKFQLSDEFYDYYSDIETVCDKFLELSILEPLDYNFK